MGMFDMRTLGAAALVAATTSLAPVKEVERQDFTKLAIPAANGSVTSNNQVTNPVDTTLSDVELIPRRDSADRRPSSASGGSDQSIVMSLLRTQKEEGKLEVTTTLSQLTSLSGGSGETLKDALLRTEGQERTDIEQSIKLAILLSRRQSFSWGGSETKEDIIGRLEKDEAAKAAEESKRLKAIVAELNKK